MGKIWYFLIFIGICVLNFGCKEKATSIAAEVKENIKRRVDQGINTGIVVGVITPKGTEFFSYGYKSLISKELINENSVFEIASISKTFTGIMLAEMVVNDDLTLNDPLQNLLPSEVKVPTRNQENILLVHLANHTSGLPRMPANFNMSNLINPFVNYSEEHSYEFLNSYELPRDIGLNYEYSNYGFGLLGHALATKEEMTYKDLLLGKICEPLKLNHTNTVFTPDMIANLAKGHKLGVEVTNWDYQSCFAGAAGIRSTPGDMVKYLSYNMGLLPTNLSKAMQLSHKNTRVNGESPQIGLAWNITPLDEMEIVWHDGETGGYRSFIGFQKNGNKGVVVLTNSNADINDIGMHLLEPSNSLKSPKPSIGIKLRRIIESEGVRELERTYLELKENHAEDFEFDENELEMLGDLYFDQGEMEKAVSVFKINTDAFPNSSYSFLSYGRALAELGHEKEAILALKKSIDLYSGNTASMQLLEKLGADTETFKKEITIEESILDSYTGKYELLPSLILEIFREGTQLKVSASGKPQHLIYPKSQNIFYYKTLPAQIIFNLDDSGETKSLTFIQEGEKIVAYKLSN